MRSDIPIENFATKYGAGFHLSCAFDDDTLLGLVCCGYAAVSAPIGTPLAPILLSADESNHFNHHYNSSLCFIMLCIFVLSCLKRNRFDLFVQWMCR